VELESVKPVLVMVRLRDEVQPTSWMQPPFELDRQSINKQDETSQFPEVSVN
jgi:hypothetical protein